MKKRHNARQIVLLLREAGVELGKGEKAPEVCRKLGLTQQTYYRWRTKYGLMASQAGTGRRAEGVSDLGRLTERIGGDSS